MEKHTDLGAKHQGSNWKGPFVAFAIVAFVGIGEVAEDVQRHMCGLESGKGPSGTCFCYASVSYTHLDVYKRQALLCPKLMKLWKMSN